MDGTRKWSRPSKRAINGSRFSNETLDDKSADLPVALGAAEAPDREATRYLSAATQLNLAYAQKVVDKVINERLRALAPTFGVDVPVVARWAIRALRTRAIRNYWLTAILTLQVGLIVILISTWPWAWIIILILLIPAWLVVSWDHHERRHNVVIGKMLRDRFDPTEAPWPPRPADRDRLRQVAERRDGNMTVFSGHSAFIGSGETVYRRLLLLDICSTDAQAQSAAKKPGPFTSHDLYLAIVEAFDRERGLAKSFDNIRVYRRLFVNGLHVQNSGKLLPDPFRAPPTSVDSELLREAAIHPSPEARTYVCIEMPGWRGQLVVTLFIRVVYAGDSLFIEWTFRVLPPIHADFLDIDNYYELPRYHQIRASLMHGLPRFIPALFASPLRMLGSWRGRRAARRHQAQRSYAIRRGYVFDYGARKSIREDASGSQRQHYFLARDETMYILLAQQTLIQAVRTFLGKHGIDLNQFDAQVKVIFDQSINYNVGDITGSTGVVIGDKSSATVNDSPQGAK